ncbi:hypothetical protein [Halobellus salinisoli]|uniref:hypothetical protein n=1 Tax=Halobellus salinisoli TaxID=3108500 RepID=UPI0030085B90
MTEKSFTLFEIHLHDGLSFSATNTAPAIGGSSSESDEGMSEDVDDSSESTDSGKNTPFSDGVGRLPIGGFIALVLLVALAAAAKHFRGEDSDALAELDDVGEE